MEFKNKEEIDRVLSALGEQLSVRTKEHVDLLVCGGSALQALRLVSRTTTDVDVVALVTHDVARGLEMTTAKSLPAVLVEAAKKVERDFQLKSGWLNPGPTSALDLGLPAGVLERAQVSEYGSALTVRFFSRLDQIHFKLYAAVDQGGKHYQDLKGLKPTAGELEQAARWSMTHDVSEGYRGELKRILKEMGQEDVAQRI
ncbi:MAG: hypothetical protein HY924_11065 [Elusimicrobia bacterium]|nr:hypothetical protein [Elusimicrobiota bacterium]